MANFTCSPLVPVCTLSYPHEGLEPFMHHFTGRSTNTHMPTSR
jgi:hypothetical protein